MQSASELRAMRWRDLQAFAKRHGVRANQKREEIIRQLLHPPPAAPPAPPVVRLLRRPPPAPLFLEKRTLCVAAFNAARLSVEASDLREEWTQLARFFGDAAHVVCMSEVPAKTAKARTDEFLRLLGSDWRVTLSEPSGTLVGSQRDVHAVFHRVGVVEARTAHRLDGKRMEYAPLTVRLSPFFEDVDVVLSSVHMPPAARARLRDTQVRNLMEGYPRSAEARLNTPFGAPRDARRKPVVHVAMGDFNVKPSSNEDWRVLVDGPTSSGGKAYDHFLVSEPSFKHVEASAEVLPLRRARNTRTGDRGISDHFPILLRLSAHHHRK